MDALIKAKNLNFLYNEGKDNEFHALINVNLEVFPTEFVIFFGPSGCGKSTLLNLIAGLESPTSGELVVCGQDMITMTRDQFALFHRKGLGMVYQAYNLITSLTVVDNVALPQVFLDVNKKQRTERAMELLERFGVKEQARKIPTELSGGQQQRIGIARSIVNDPDLVLADEPVGNLDSASAQNVLELLKELNEKEKKTIILVTHNPENLVYGDRIIHMKDGMVIREVVNRQKGKKEKMRDLSRPPTSELESLMRAYQGLTPEQINILIMPYKAKLFTHHFITSRNLDETKIFEDVMQRKLLGTVTQEELFDILHRSIEQGGVGFDGRTAERLLRRVNRTLRMAYFVYQKVRQRKDETGKHPPITVEEKAQKLVDYLLRSCYQRYYKHLDDLVILRLRNAVKDRLSNTINRADLNRILDMPFKEGGVGLNSKTARSITEELELVLILGYGVTQAQEMARLQAERDRDDKEREAAENADTVNTEIVVAPDAPATTAGDVPAALPAKTVEPERKPLNEEQDLGVRAPEPGAAEIDAVPAPVPAVRSSHEPVTDQDPDGPEH